MAGAKEPCFKQIIGLDENNKFIPKEEVINEIFLDHAVKDQQVCVISMAGIFTKNKCLVMNHILRHLNVKCKSKKLSENWIDWNNDFNKDSVGVWVWSEVFLYECPTGEQIAIILMDTKTTDDFSVKFLTLAALLSSVQIFTVKEDITQSDLEFFDFAFGYEREKNHKYSGAPFQGMHFLITDSSHEYESGVKGGKEFLKKIMQCLKIEADNVPKIYERVTCHVLANSEEVNNDESSQGEIVDSDRVPVTEEFLLYVLSHEEVIPKAINGHKIKLGDIIPFIQMYCSHFSDGETLSPHLIHMVTTQAYTEIITSEIRAQYQTAMESVCNQERSLTYDVLEQESRREREKLMDFFNKKNMNAYPELTDKIKKKLQSELDKNFLEYKIANKKKQEKENEATEQDEICESQKDVDNRIQKIFTLRRKADGLRRQKHHLERQLLNEKNKHNHASYQMELESLKQGQMHQEEIERKEKEFRKEKKKYLGKKDEDVLQRAAAQVQSELQSKIEEFEKITEESYQNVLNELREKHRADNENTQIIHTSLDYLKNSLSNVEEQLLTKIKQNDEKYQEQTEALKLKQNAELNALKENFENEKQRSLKEQQSLEELLRNILSEMTFQEQAKRQEIEKTAEVTLTQAVNDGEQTYQHGMEVNLNTEKASKTEELEKYHTETKLRVFELFSTYEKAETPEVNKKFRKLLKNKLEKHFASYKLRNAMKREEEKEEKIAEQQKLLAEQQIEAEKMNEWINKLLQKYEESMNITVNAEKAITDAALEDDHFAISQEVLNLFDEIAVDNVKMKSKFRKLLKEKLHQLMIHNLEIQLQTEKSRQNELHCKLRDLKQKQAPLEVFQKKQEELDKEREKFYEEKLAHQQILLDEKLKQRIAEIEAEQISKLRDAENHHRDEMNNMLSSDNKSIKEDKEELRNTLQKVTDVMEKLLHEDEDEAVDENDEKSGCVLA